MIYSISVPLLSMDRSEGVALVGEVDRCHKALFDMGYLVVIVPLAISSVAERPVNSGVFAFLLEIS